MAGRTPAPTRRIITKGTRSNSGGGFSRPRAVVIGSIFQQYHLHVGDFVVDAAKTQRQITMYRARIR